MVRTTPLSASDPYLSAQDHEEHPDTSVIEVEPNLPPVVQLRPKPLA